MEDIQQAPETGTVETTEATPEGLPDAIPQPSEGVEDRARRMGWKDKTEFSKAPEAWVDADTFVKRSEEELPIMRERLRWMENQRKEDEGRYKEIQAVLLQTKDMLMKNTKNSFEEKKQQYQAAINQARASGDTQLYDAYLLQFAKFLETNDVPDEKKPEPKQETSLTPGQLEYLQDWNKENTWFNTDPDLNAQAVAYFNTLERTDPNGSFYKRVKDTEKYIKEKNPAKFGKPAPKFAAVEGGSSVASVQVNKSYESIPGEVKTIYDNMLRHMPFYGKRDQRSLKATEDYKRDCVEQFFGGNK